MRVEETNANNVLAMSIYSVVNQVYGLCKIKQNFPTFGLYLKFGSYRFPTFGLYLKFSSYRFPCTICVY